MNFSKIKLAAGTLLFLTAVFVHAQINIGNKVTLNGSLQSDILVPEIDEEIGTETSYPGKVLTNTYLDLNLRSKYVNAGARFEYLDFPLPGFEKDFAGWGVPYLYVSGKYKNVELTVGDFYDQFGSGFIFRTYEERSLGVDNSLRGGRLVFQPYKGINVKMLGGTQRRYWKHNDSYVWGADAEFSIDQWSKRLQESNTFLMFGASYVGKHEKDEIIDAPLSGMRLNLPLNVSAFDVRAQLQKGGYNFLVEYAVKGNDPTEDNNYIYKNGTALMLSGSYSQRGLSALVQVKRSDNMSFRSKRRFDDVTTSSFINNLPVFSMQHTYSLATVYPYATQMDGEWAFQGEFGYNFKRKTALGGKYGTNVKLGFSHIRSIYGMINPMDKFDLRGTDGTQASFFDMGDEVFYQDLNVNIEKKISKSFKMNFMYMYQIYNPKANMHVGEDLVKSNIFIWEGKYQINKKVTVRAELQYLLANKYQHEGDLSSPILDRSNQGDWMFGLLEVSLLPSFMFTVSDMYNVGATDLHYYMVSAVYTHKAHRLQLGYGRTRKGYTCSGGVCRSVPASKGFQASYNFNF